MALLAFILMGEGIIACIGTNLTYSDKNQYYKGSISGILIIYTFIILYLFGAKANRTQPVERLPRAHKELQEHWKKIKYYLSTDKETDK